MWSPSSSQWVCHAVDFDGDRLDPDRATGPWSGHRGFVYDLLRWRQPESIVELGTHYGVSLFAICQALRDAGSAAVVHAIDTWAGDEHAGFYDDDVFEVFRKNLAGIGYPHVQLHRTLFIEALANFADESIDLIHIDGLHTYEALQEDFETWLPKLAPNGLVLLHDIATSSGYGSAEYFHESIVGTYPTRMFDHNFGLGIVLPKGTESWEFLLSDEWGRWADTYRRGALAATFGRMVVDQAEMISARDELIKAQDGMVDHRDQAIRSQTSLIDERDRYIEQLEWELQSRESALAQSNRSLRAAEDELLRIRDRAEYLEWLDVSPRLQVKALGRSVPKAVAKRTRAARRRARNARSGVSTASSKESDRAVCLRQLIDQHFDAAWYAARHGLVPDNARQAYLTRGLAEGHAVNAAHERALVLEASERTARTSPQPAFTLHGKGRPASGHLPDLIAMARPEVVTVDLWDTVIVRDRPADAAKTATGRRMLALVPRLPVLKGMTPLDLLALREAVELEIATAHSHEEYRIDEVLDLMLQRLGLQDRAERASWVTSLREAEVDDEIRWSRPQQEVASALLANPSWIVMSDFYMSAEDLRQILEGVLGRPIPNRIVSSADCLASKRTGAGFDRLRDELGCTPAGHVHIGDNPIADIDFAIKGGGRAIHVQLPPSVDPPGRLNRGSVTRLVERLDESLDQLAPGATPERSAGRRSALLAVAVVERALTEARRQGLDRVHYVSREGMFLLEVHRVLEPLLRFGQQEPVVPVHLAVSRRSTFGATVQSPIPLSLHRMWSMYGRQSTRALLTSIGVDPALLAGVLERVGLELDRPIDGIASDELVRRFLEDAEAAAVIESECEARRRELVGYLRSVTSIEDPWVLVDIGWRGTIQDNLARATGVPSLTGVYFGLFPFLNPQPGNSRKIAVGFDGNRGDDFTFAEPPAVLERPWTVDAPSTIGYRVLDHGEVELVQHTEPGEVSAGIREFQAGVLDAVPVVAAWLVGHGLTAEVLEDALHEEARSFWEDPSPAVAGIWFDSDHDDTFGVLNQTSFGKVRPDPTWLDGRLHDHLGQGERASGWSAGYLRWRPVRALTTLVEIGG